MAAPEVTEIPVVGLRQPCPCGSGRRYKACHGRADDRRATRVERVARPFAGVADECDWVALRELVPAATATVALAAGGRDVLLVSLLPDGWPALVRDDGTILLALQVGPVHADAGLDVAGGLLAALAAEPGEPVTSPASPDGRRVADLLDPSAPLTVTVAPDFGFWTEGWDAGSLVRDARERAAAGAIPTSRLSSVEAAYWCSIGDREHLRWVQPHDEDALLDALARLHVREADRLLDGARLVGSFRACGLLVPVWDLPAGTGAEALEEPARQFQERLGEALAVTAQLTVAERGARSGLASRQLTLR